MTKKEVNDFIESKSGMLFEVSDKVWDAAETAFEEVKSTEALCAVLEKEGFAITRNLANIETAFCGRFGSGHPVIGILGEFDALSGLNQVAGIAEKEMFIPDASGHGCGHNLLGAGALGAAIGVKKYLEETGKPGTVIYYGCPAEEGGSGKTYMARDGIFNELDCALTWHPGDVNGVMATSSLANYQVYYRFKGVSAHAAANPHQGRSALDAIELMNVGVQFLREHVIQEARIHYAITNTGGYSPNVVQPYAEAIYLMRAPKNPEVEHIYKRINKIAEGAALMTETELEIDFGKGCSNLVRNSVLEKLFQDNLEQSEKLQFSDEDLKYAAEIGKTLESSLPKIKGQLAKSSVDSDTLAKLSKAAEAPIYDFIMPYSPTDAAMPGSTDVGDVSWICPTAQIGTATWAAGTPAHSWQAVAQGKSSFAHKGLLYAGQMIADTAIDLIDNPALVEKAKAEHEMRLENNPYKCPIPDTVKPRKLTK